MAQSEEDRAAIDQARQALDALGQEPVIRIKPSDEEEPSVPAGPGSGEPPPPPEAPPPPSF